MNDRKSLASWALFKRMYDIQGDVYEVIGDFIKYTIYKNVLRNFTIFQLTQEVNNTFGIHLIDAVIKRAIKKLQLSPNHGVYTCNPNDYPEQASIKDAINDTNRERDAIIQSLFDFVEKRKGSELLDGEKESLVGSLNDFLLDKKIVSNHIDEIANFVISCNQDLEKKQQLKNMKEGIVLYSGMNYNANTGDASKVWRSPMTVFLDTEILFHFAGFNGETYKRLFDDFFNLVNEINSDNRKKIQTDKIKLRYFSYTLKEIDNFFGKAEDIVNGKSILIESVTAMKNITKGCLTTSDVQDKKAIFLQNLQTMGIHLDENEDVFYKESNYSLNIESKEYLEKFSKESDSNESEVLDSIRSLSHIFVLRKGKKECPFEQGGYILLTDNRTTQYIAWNDEIKGISGNVLCTDLYFFTDRLWCRLGKSFGSNNTPKVFDVVSRAQIILSNKLNYSITSKYEELLEKYQKGEITKENALAAAAALREKVMNPEDIEAQCNIDSVTESITQHDINYYLQEQERKENEYQRVLKEKSAREVELSTRLNAEIEENQKKTKEIMSTIKQKDDEIASIKESSVPIEQFKELAKAHEKQAEEISELKNTTVDKNEYLAVVNESNDKDAQIENLKETTVSKEEYSKAIANNNVLNQELISVKLKSWRNPRYFVFGLWSLVWLFLVVLCFAWSAHKWNLVARMLNWIDSNADTMKSSILKSIIIAIWIFVAVFLFNVFYNLITLKEKPQNRKWLYTLFWNYVKKKIN